MRILVTGGRGRLARAIGEYVKRARAVEHEVLLLGKEQLNVLDLAAIATAIRINDISLVINCAAVLSAEAERDHYKAWSVNVNGTSNQAFVCKTLGARFVHISTDYVFDGEAGDYREEDPPNPVNYYGLTKTSAEACITMMKGSSSLILRAPFRHPDKPWPHSHAFIDQRVSARWTWEVVPDIIEAATDRGLTGILHIGGLPKTVFDMARAMSPEVGAMCVDDFRPFRIPRNVTLNSGRWRNYMVEKQLKVIE